MKLPKSIGRVKNIKRKYRKLLYSSSNLGAGGIVNSPRWLEYMNIIVQCNEFLDKQGKV